MRTIASVIVFALFVVHLSFAVAEIFFWRSPSVHGRLEFYDSAVSKRVEYAAGTSVDAAAPIVANAGIYNSFIAAGLLWGLRARKRQETIRYFFLGCVIVAGLFGSFTLWTWGPLLMQTVPALIAIGAMAYAKPKVPWELGKEYVPLDEPADIEECVRLANWLQTKSNATPMRGQHAKGIGAVRAKLIVGEAADPRMAAGIFAEPKTYDAILRFSNGTGKVKPDTADDARGLAIRVLGVSGQRCLPNDQDGTVQDFVMINFPAFAVRDAEQYATFLALRKLFFPFPKSVTLAGLTFFIPFRFRQFKDVASKLQRPCNSLLEETYWSMSPFRLGEHAVKFSVAPTLAPVPPTDKIADRADDFLSQDLRKRVAEQEVVFSVRVQFQVDPYRTPIEDPTIIWDETLAPPIEAAKLVIEKGALDDPAANQELHDQVEAMAFNVWHALEAHRPLGGINRVRKAVYPASAANRLGSS